MAPQTAQASATIEVYSPQRQGVGAFDGGKITEIKPIDFPGGTSQGKRLGPLFYWAWASAKGDGVIGMHPHKGFEIISYVLDGEIGHSDTLGHRNRIGAGGAQVMQTGAGISHQEEMYGQRTEFFQIWFEPDLRQAVTRPPQYGQYIHEEFDQDVSDGLRVKAIIGPGAPVQLVAPVRMADVEVDPGKSYRHDFKAGQALAAMTVSGRGVWTAGAETATVQAKDYTVLTALEDTNVELKANEAGPLRVVWVETPLEVDYPLYR